ncbi:Na+/H+ antiporter [Streptomyces sp. DSM 44915]|uniref:Na+/H+ antiporter n=1 Tax=Streptomyces chisholmiae TaxID=3075540 RepID=A0ABU2JJ26_9ACTN|nr:Na+/H+ antiporter [Streptomyces sp. DSM 44915]MDT0264991.1 Na+/H+ antiporter [Streptomyces sp. DSM 44915]
MDQLTLLFALLLGSVVMVPVAERLRLPPPVLMTVLGGLLALLPLVPEVRLPPEFILPLILPPVLYTAVQRTSWRQFAANVRPILLLAVALVFVTTAAVAVVAQAVVPGMPLAPAIALGALVAPPDPVAATAVAGRLGLPRRMVSILEGEGLFNDVTAITLYHVAIAAAVTGSFSAWHAGGELVLSAVVAVLVGLVLGWLTARLLALLGDATLRTGLTLLAPFAAYALAEELRGSGVLAVLVAALFLAERASDPDDVAGRLTGQSFWGVLDLLVTGVAFGLIGLELNVVFSAAAGRWGELLPAAGLVLVAVVLVRLLWLLPAAWLAQRLHRGGDLDEDIPHSWRETVIMWWSGMRGVASIALALAVPLTVDGGGAFPERDALVFIAFVVVLGTLLIQGLTLPWLAGRLGVRGDSRAEEALEHELAVRAARAAKARLREITAERELPEEVSEALLRRAYDIGLRISPRLAEEDRREQATQRAERARDLLLLHAELLSAARHAVLAARAEPGVDPEVVDRVLHELDRRSLPHG